MKRLLPAAAACALSALVSEAAAQSCSSRSPPHTVALLELYTSEGCDSCPPADRFVSSLRALGLTSTEVVPLSLHVDYWDYIGWKDVFAQRRFTERQRWLSALAKSRTVYTPEIFIAGRELRNWRGDVPATVARINRRPAQASIALALGSVGQDRLPLQLTANAAPGAQAYVALFENGLTSHVKAGENRGATLRHDYVVRDWIGPVPLAGDGRGSVPLPRALEIPAGAVTQNLGVAAFVQARDGEVLQALAMPVCGSGSH